MQAVVGRLDETLFGESHASYLISYAPENEGAIKASLVATNANLQFSIIGTVTKNKTIDFVVGNTHLETVVEVLQSVWM